jgi:hypothetical protein
MCVDTDAAGVIPPLRGDASPKKQHCRIPLLHGSGHTGRQGVFLVRVSTMAILLFIAIRLISILRILGVKSLCIVFARCHSNQVAPRLLLVCCGGYMLEVASAEFINLFCICLHPPGAPAWWRGMVVVTAGVSVAQCSG